MGNAEVDPMKLQNEVIEDLKEQSSTKTRKEVLDATKEELNNSWDPEEDFACDSMPSEEMDSSNQREPLDHDPNSFEISIYVRDVGVQSVEMSGDIGRVEVFLSHEAMIEQVYVAGTRRKRKEDSPH